MSPSQGNVRRLIEAMQETKDVLQMARVLEDLSDFSAFRSEDLVELNRQFPTPFVNIGGGPTFHYPLWKNLDAVKSLFNPDSFYFAPDCRLPFDAGSMKLVYSSHALEHLDNPTVDRVIGEASRILQPDGALVIKIPDYEVLLAAVRNNDPAPLADALWGFSTVTPTLANRGFEDGLHVRAAYIFCGFWNRAFGNVFEKYDVHAPGSYNGPAPMGIDGLTRLLAESSPQQIASEMRECVIANESDFTFNHQNAWSVDEFVRLLASHGLEVVSTDKAAILRRYSYIPRLREMYGISNYYVAFPVAGGAAR